MKSLIVCLKQAVDVSRLKVDPATRHLITAGAPKKISDFDKNALEEAIRIKEKIGEAEVCTVTVSSEDAKAVLREALAIGADKAYFVNNPSFQDVDIKRVVYSLTTETMLYYLNGCLCFGSVTKIPTIFSDRHFMGSLPS